MFSTEGVDDPRDLHTEEELSTRDQTRILLREAANVLQTCSITGLGEASVTKALSSKIGQFLLERATIEFLGKPGSRQSVRPLGRVMEEIAEKIAGGLTAHTHQQVSRITISTDRSCSWEARAVIDATQESFFSKGSDPMEALCGLQKNVTLILQQRKELLEKAIASMSSAEEDKP